MRIREGLAEIVPAGLLDAQVVVNGRVAKLPNASRYLETP